MFIAYVFVHCHVICNSPVYGGNKEYLLTNIEKNSTKDATVLRTYF